MNIECNEKIAVHQGFGYISIGNFIGIDTMSGRGNCVVIRVRPCDDEGCSLGGDIYVSFDEFRHGKGIFQLKKDGYNKWLVELEEKVKKENIYHKWNSKQK